MTVYMFFSEPITLSDSSHIAVYRNRKTAAGKVAQYGTEPWLLYLNTNTNTSSNSTGASVPKALKYDRFNRQLSFQLVNYCADSFAEATCLSGKQPWENLFAFLNQTGSTEFGYFLSLGAGTVEDMALTSNPLKEITERLQVLEGSPGELRVLRFTFYFLLSSLHKCLLFHLSAYLDCSTCGTGQYVSRACTATTDRECRPCSTCLSGQYIAEACSAHHDTSCAGEKNELFLSFILSIVFKFRDI